MIKTVYDYIRILGLLTIGFYIAVSVNNQITYTLRPFLKSYRTIPHMLSKDDIGQVKELYPSVYRIMEKINRKPEDTNFYFAPSFYDESWWYLYVRARYLCYPRRIFVHNPLLYRDTDREEYIRRFIGDSERYDELDWVKGRGIEYIILFRDKDISVIPADSKIVL